MIRKVMTRYSVQDPDDGAYMIEIRSLADMMTYFNYECSATDRQELKFFLFNNGAIEKSLRQHNLRKDKVYIDIEVLLDLIKQEFNRMGLCRQAIDGSQTTKGTMHQIGMQIVKSQVGQVQNDLATLYRLKGEDAMIGERELRRVLSNRLQLSDCMMNVLIDNLRTQDVYGLFRSFKVSEVLACLQQITYPFSGLAEDFTNTRPLLSQQTQTQKLPQMSEIASATKDSFFSADIESEATKPYIQHGKIRGDVYLT